VAKIRIVAVADTHTFHEELGALPDGDVFVHAGDLLRAGTLEELAGVADWIRSLPHRVKVVVAGNHDWAFARQPDQALHLLGPEVVYLKDSSATLCGLTFWGSPWQPEYNGWAFNLPRGAALAERWSLIPPGMDVLITHGPPRGYGDRSPIEGRAGCDDLLVGIDRVKPTLHLFGHIHQDGGLWWRNGVCLVNATTWECERSATVVDIEMPSKRASPIEIPPARKVG
jgi:Icc-related predicted phosphoesterase